MWSSRFNMNAPPGALQNKKGAYYLSFRSRVATSLEIATDPKHLGALENALGLGLVSVAAAQEDGQERSVRGKTNPPAGQPAPTEAHQLPVGSGFLGGLRLF